MIPRTFPSTFAANGQQQMVVYSLPSITGLRAWIDYIPVKGVTTESATLANTYANGGYQIVNSLASLTGKQAWLDYIPVYEDPSYNKPWSTDAGGYIPTSALAALLLDFTSGRLDPRITFSRTTNATLTNSAGLIANAPMNLLTFSEQFDNAAWGKYQATVTANAGVAPNGTTTADLLVDVNATSNQHQTESSAITTVATTYTYSVYAKAGSLNWIKVCGIAEDGVFFNISSGSIGSATAGYVGAITAVGNGWYRCAITFTATAASNNFRLQLATANNVSYYTANGTGNIYLWGAQLELGSTATTYNPTTVKNLLGFTENFDNAAWTKSNAFVQTNLLLQSEAFDSASWASAGGTVTANTLVSPAGSVTADTLTGARFQSPGFSSNTFTFSCYAKKNDGNNQLSLRIDSPTSNASVFDLNTGTVVSNGAGMVGTITNAGNGWYRCSTTFTSAVVNFVIISANNGSNSTYIWGAQLVQGTTPGDYKATYAAAAAVGYTDIYGQPFAQKLVETTAASTTHRILNNSSVTISTAGPSTTFCYAKAAERTAFRLTDNDIQGADFDLLTGAVSNLGAGVTASSTSIGNGWWRIAVTRTSSTANGRLIAYLLSGGSDTYTGDGTSGIYIFGAQLSDSASVDPYVYQPVAAPTSTAYYGPRFDYDPVTLAPKGLLIEEQRTNLLTYSEQFDNAAWAKSGATVTANFLVSPDGTTTADKLIEGANTGAHLVAQLTTTSAASHALTVYAKAAERTRLILANITAGYSYGFDVSTGTTFNDTYTAGDATATIQSVGNGWYRCSIVGTATAASNNFRILLCDGGISGSYTGNGTSGIYIYGAQLEAGAFATSYIPTVASQVTRAADSASMIGNNFARWYNQTEGTLFSDVSQFALPSVTVNPMLISNGASLSFSIGLATFGTAAGFQVVDNTTQANLGPGSVTANVNYKLSGVYKLNDFASSLNGAAVVTDTSGTVPTGMNTLGIGVRLGGAAYLNGTIKRIAYYNRRLSNTELQGITS